MSYGFKIMKDAEGIHVEDVSPGMLEHVPNGIFTISGHKASGSPAYSDIETLQITLTEGDRYVISAQASARPRKVEDSE